MPYRIHSVAALDISNLEYLKIYRLLRIACTLIILSTGMPLYHISTLKFHYVLISLLLLLGWIKSPQTRALSGNTEKNYKMRVAVLESYLFEWKVLKKTTGVVHYLHAYALFALLFQLFL